MPTLVQFAALTPAHFESSPIWASCHSFDHDEPWYDETNEETFRPWTGAVPVDPADGMFLVRAQGKLSDGTVLPGFLTPTAPDVTGEQALGLLQPQLFLPSGQCLGFWLGMFGDPAAASSALYGALGKPAASIFPIQVTAERGLCADQESVEIRGFYTTPDGESVQVHS